MQHSDAFLARFEQLHPKLIDLSLGRMQNLLEKLGHPERRLPPVIHVAGTNGKGSTIAFLRAMLEASGAKVHVFTSPHLMRFHERIRLAAPGGGKLVGEEALVAAFARVEAVNAGAPITQFEITTAAAFELFVAHEADFLLLEVGLGGRLDSTNVVPQPLASVITPISMDHREFLGETIAAIAAEKAGIIRAGTPVIIAEQGAAAAEICLQAARKKRSLALLGGQDFRAYEENGRLVYQSDEICLDLPLPRLAGRHQIGNAATAIATLLAVAPERATPRAIEAGLQNVQWPARLQRLQGHLLALAPAGAELWLDGGHNADGARALAEAMSALEERAARPLILLAGTMARKDAAEILLPFVGLAQEFYALPVPSMNARSPDEMAEIARGLGMPAAMAGSLESTLRLLAARAWPVPPRLLIAGSLYLAGAVLAADGVVLS